METLTDKKIYITILYSIFFFFLICFLFINLNYDELIESTISTNRY